MSEWTTSQSIKEGHEILSTREYAAIRALAVRRYTEQQFAMAREAFHRARMLYPIHICAELLYMNEVLETEPDLLLKAFFREAVIANWWRWG